MSWLSDFLSALKPSSREEHFWAKIAGEEELENEYLPSSREEGFMYKIAEKVSAGGEAGYAVEETKTAVYDGSATAADAVVGGYIAAMPVAADLYSERACITFNGVEYLCDKRVQAIGNDGDYVMYGAGYSDADGFDFSEFPFLWMYSNTSYEGALYMQTQGPNTIKAEALDTKVEATEDFQLARGYVIGENPETVFEDTVTGEAQGTDPVYYVAQEELDAPLDAEQIIVTFNDTAYELNRRTTVIMGTALFTYGGNLDLASGPDFSEYPFVLLSSNGRAGLAIYTTTAGPNTIKVETVGETVTPTDEFKAAVVASGSGGGGYDPYIIEVEGYGTGSMTTDADYATAKEKFLAHEPVFVQMSAEGSGNTQSANYLVPIMALITFSESEVSEVLAAFLPGGSSIMFASDGSVMVP